MLTYLLIINVYCDLHSVQDVPPVPWWGYMNTFLVVCIITVTVTMCRTLVGLHEYLPGSLCNHVSAYCDLDNVQDVLPVPGRGVARNRVTVRHPPPTVPQTIGKRKTSGYMYVTQQFLLFCLVF